MVNGAGLAMSTMDIIQFKGAEPANFLDVGGGATQQAVEAAFRIITKDPSVKGILVNIFGGIMKCDVIANGVIGAIKEVGLEVPLVVRLSGTNAELGKKILAESGPRRHPREPTSTRPPTSHRRRRAGGLNMSILVNKDTRLLCQGITGKSGAYHCKQMLEYGTQLVGGVVPGKGGRPSRTPACRSSTASPRPRPTGANASVIFVPPPFAADGIMEAVDAELDLAVCITEGIPVAT